MDWLDFLAVQGTLKSLLQHHSSKTSILQHTDFFTVQLSHPYSTLDDMKGQVKVKSDDNLPFWTSVLSWVKGDWRKTIFTIVIVALIALLFVDPLFYNVL